MSRIGAVLLDFYGTVVHEDDTLIAAICAEITAAATDPIAPEEVGTFWAKAFRTGCGRAHGPAFRTQRDIELASVAETLDHFAPTARLDADQYCERLFTHWRQPPIFDDARRFLDACPSTVPVVVASNIDRVDLEAAIAHHGLSFDHIITSEDVRSYKPRPELFAAALDAVDLDDLAKALHIGDSLGSDVAGANAAGIPVAWVNRSDRSAPSDSRPTYEVNDLEQLIPLVTAPR